MGRKISIIGSGNVATNLAHAFDRAGHDILQVISANSERAKQLANCFGAYYGNSISSVDLNADFIIICVNDESYFNVLEELPKGLKSIICHTSGPVSMDVISDYAPNFGVFYPLQSLRKEKYIDFLDVPIFIEGNSNNVRENLMNLADTISNKISEVSSVEREKYHLAAVFANNFTNLMYTLSHKYLEDESLDFQNLIPIIKETANRLADDKPESWQTGPAKRGDTAIMQKHIDMLEDPRLKEIYKQLSDYIRSN
ncbi:F420-dependent NADP oxidoreductase [Bacteroidia bacterium]|nr:F420-dependent NADP oxidoreductase [Bacteroidia bacterium]MDC0561470.1 F420-dependent NADP oxidoreductase [Bacteroidia bacterium]MDC3406355.1 F420-dependent NADP oxidoreductase [Bacteroidia bacterium]